MTIEVRPATSFDDVAAVLGPKRPDATVCWCLSYRLTSSRENQSLSGVARGDRVRELCGQEPPPGVLAYDGDEVTKAADTTSVLNGFPRVLMRLDLR